MRQCPFGVLHPPGQRLLGINPHEISIGRVFRQICELVGIAAQVEEQRGQRGEVDIFIGRILHDTQAGMVHPDPRAGFRRRVEHIPKIVFVMQFRSPVRRQLGIQQRQQ